MPGYLAEPSSNAAGVSIIPSGNLSSSNIQSAIYELDSEKADGISVNNSLNTKAPINNPTLTGTTVMTTASVANNLTVNGNTLFVDTVNNRVGIGNNSLTSQLHIKQQSGINDAIYVEGYNGGGAKIYRKESDGSIRFDAIQQGFSDIVFSTTPNSGTITERMKIDSSGRVTMPYQPFFKYGILTAAAVSGATRLGPGISLLSDRDARTSIYFNTSTGRFTAPITGNYMFNMTIMRNGSVSSTPGIDAQIVKNEPNPTGQNSSNTYGRLYVSSTSVMGDYEVKSITTTIYLNTNDYIAFDITAGSTYSDDSYIWGIFLG